MKLNMCINLNCIHGLVYLRALIMKINFTKQIFIQDIEEGLETMIPKDLSQARLPYSCRYYDPILAILQSGITDDRK